MNPLQWYKKAWRDWGTTSGRSRRREYGWFSLLSAPLTGLFLYFVESEMLGPVLLMVFVMIPVGVTGITLSIRRLHDLGVSGWFVLCNFIPYGNIAVAVVLLFKDGQSGPNRFGPDPKDPLKGMAEVF